MAIHEVAARFYEGQVRGSWVPDYLAGRGFDREVQRHWRAGYAQAERDALSSRLRSAGYAEGTILAAGLARRSSRGVLVDTFRDRVMLPIRAAGGSIIAFVGRAPELARPTVPKYLNSPRTPLYDKGGVLFGLWESRAALAAGGMPVIAEGPFDVLAIACAAGGCYAPVSTCGTSLTARQVMALRDCCDLGAVDVIVAFDADSAGRRAALAAYHLLSPFARRVLTVRLPPAQDPAQVLREHGRDVLARSLRDRLRPLADLVVDAQVGEWASWLSFAEGKIGALRSAASAIAAMPPADVARQASRLAGRLQLDHETVTLAVIEALAR